jgi:hypothetical protein
MVGKGCNVAPVADADEQGPSVAIEVLVKAGPPSKKKNRLYEKVEEWLDYMQNGGDAVSWRKARAVFNHLASLKKLDPDQKEAFRLLEPFMRRQQGYGGEMLNIQARYPHEDS